MTHTSSPSYQVLARKYRPQNFADVAGQEELVQTLTNAIQTQRIPHAFLFTGVRGVGKTTSARLIARALNCIGPDGQGQETISPCGKCQQCLDILGDRHLDVIEMDAASRTGVEDIREIIDASRYKPVAARYKVHIIDEVHMLSKHAFNALLKTLEEPPAHIKFIFATTEIHRVPDTIISRCMRFDLKRFSFEQLKALLSRVATAESVTIEPDALTYLAQGAAGSARDGLSLLERAIALSHPAITTESVRSMMGLADRNQVVTLLQNLIEGDAKAALILFKTCVNHGANPTALLSDLSDAVHELTVSKFSPDLRQQPMFTTENYQQLQDLANGLSIPIVTRLWQVLQKGLNEVKQSSTTQQACEMVLIRLAYLSDVPATEDVIKSLRNSPPEARTQPQSNANVTIITPNKDPIPATFEALIELCAHHKETALKFALINDVYLSTYDPAVPSLEIQLGEKADADLAAKLKKSLESWTGKSWQIKVVQSGGAPTIREAQRQQEAALWEQAENHPTVKEVLATFPGAKIKDVKPLKNVS
jgi:DNA polymerase-3 subunit gamma/tau